MRISDWSSDVCSSDLANVDYSWNLGTETKAFVGASLRSLSKQRANFDAGFGALYGLGRRTIPAYEVIDLRAGVDFGRVSVEVFAKNLGNSRGITDLATGGGLPVAPGGAITAGILRPRTVAIGSASWREKVGQLV